MSTSKKKNKRNAKAGKPKIQKFDHKAKKGTTRVHIIMTVDDRGNVGIWHVYPNTSIDEAINLALEHADSPMEAAYDVYHLDQTLAVPKRIIKKATKARAKKIKSVAAQTPAAEPTETPAPILEDRGGDDEVEQDDDAILG